MTHPQEQNSEWIDEDLFYWMREKKTKAEALAHPRFADLVLMLVSYDPETGVLLWKERPEAMFVNARFCKRWNTRYAGKKALTFLSDRGYPCGTICGAPVFAHQVAMAVSTGRWPHAGVDHLNGIHHDNRLENLREASQALNNRNTVMRRNNTSGHTGVNFHSGSWVARIGIGGGERVVIGRFGTKEEAVLARKAKALELGYSARHGLPYRLHAPTPSSQGDAQ